MSQNALNFPISEFRYITQACRPDEPLEPNDSRFVDLTSLREGDSVVDELGDTLLQELEDNRFHRGILSGHTGSGKSTELLNLKAWADANGFLCLRVEVNVYFGSDIDLEFSDMYLLAAEIIQKGLLTENIKLPKQTVERIALWFAEVIQEDGESRTAEMIVEAGAEIKGEVPLLAKLFASLKSKLALSSEHHTRVRQNIRQRPDQLIDLVNDLIRVANEKLESTALAPQGLLLLFDNLDRYPHDAISRLLTQGTRLMQRLKCHTVYTIPVDLRPLSGNVYSDDFDCNVVLPIPALRRETDRWASSVENSDYNEEAVTKLRTLLAKRLDIDALFENPDDAIRLIKMSGGCVRDLMHLINDARKRSSSVSRGIIATQISTTGVNRSILDQRNIRSEGILEADYQRLARIARHDPEAAQPDPVVLGYLGKRWVFQYHYGERWLDVHPLLIETAGFKRAIEALNQIGGGATP